MKFCTTHLTILQAVIQKISVNNFTPYCTDNCKVKLKNLCLQNVSQYVKAESNASNVSGRREAFTLGSKRHRMHWVCLST